MTDASLPQVILAPEPFTPRAEVLKVPRLGQKVSDMVAGAIAAGKLDPKDIRRLAIHVNGEALPWETAEERLAAMRYVPKAGDIINLVVMVHGGGGGGGNKVLQTVLTLAVIALSVWTGGAAGPLASAAPWIRAAAAAAVQVGGSMAINAVFSSKPESMGSSNDPGALQDQSNSYRPRSPMPLCMGRRRWAFDLAAPPFTKNIGGTVWLTLALAPHYGKCWAGNYKVGETLLSDYPASDYQIEEFLTPGVPRASRLYPNSVIQENFQDKLDFTGGGVWEVHTASAGASRIAVDITLPSGLKYAADSGKQRNEEIAGQIQFAEQGTENWTAATFPGFNTARTRTNAALPPGSFYFNRKTIDPIRETFEWEAPDPLKQYKVRVKAWDPDGDFPDDGARTWATYWTAIKSIFNVPPVTDQTLSVIFVSFKSSDDLNGSLPLFTGECEPIYPVFKNGNWNTEERTSNGAALLRGLLTGPAAAKPLLPTQYHSSLEATYQLIEANPSWKGALLVTDDKSQEDVMIGLGKMGRFSTFWNGSKLCFVPDWTRDAPRQVFSGRNAGGYRYRRTFPDPCHAVFVEFLNLDEGAVEDEMYVYADGYNAANATLIDGLRIDFACTGARAFQEGRVYLAKRLLQVEMHEWSAGPEAIATTYGDRVLVRHPATLYGLADGRVVNRIFQGALVSGFRLDEEVEMVAGKTYGVDIRRADRIIRNVPVVTTPGTHRVLTFGNPRNVADAPQRGDLVIFGETGIISEDLEIIDMEPQEDQTVQFRGIPYIGPTIAGAINNPIPPIISMVTARVPPPRPIITPPESATPEDGVILQATVPAWFSTPIAGFASRWRLIFEDQEGVVIGEWEKLEPVSVASGVIRTGPINTVAHPPSGGQDARVDIEVRTLLVNGETSAPTQIYGVPLVADVPTPGAFTAVGVKRTSSDGSSYGAIEITAAPVTVGAIQTLEVEVRLNGGADWVAPPGGLFSARNPRGDLTGLLAGAPGYDVRGRLLRADNWPGPWVEIPDVVIPEGANVASDVAPGAPIQVLAALNSQQIAEEILRGALWRSYSDALLYFEGHPVATYISSLSQQFTDLEGSTAQVLSLIGAKNQAGTGFILNIDSVLIPNAAGGGSVTSFRELSLTTDQNKQAIQTLQQVTDGFAESTTLLTVEKNGRQVVTGIRNTNDGTIGTLQFQADTFAFVDPNGGSRRVPFSYGTDNLLRLTDTRVEGDLIVTGSIFNEKLAANQITGLAANSSTGTVQLNGITPTTVIDVWIDVAKADSPVKVSFRGLVLMLHNASGSFSAYFNLIRSNNQGVEVSLLNPVVGATGDTYDAVDGTYGFDVLDNPGIGTWRYRMEMRSSTNNMTIQRVSYPYMDVLEFKNNRV